MYFRGALCFLALSVTIYLFQVAESKKAHGGTFLGEDAKSRLPAVLRFLVDQNNGKVEDNEGRNPTVQERENITFFKGSTDEDDDDDDWTDKISRQYAGFFRQFMLRFPTVVEFSEFILKILEDKNSGVSQTCSSHIQHSITALKEGRLWALKMADSWGKLNPGFLELYLIFRGEFLECQNLKVKGHKKSMMSDVLSADTASELPQLTYMGSQQQQQQQQEKLLNPSGHVSVKTNGSDSRLQDHNKREVLFRGKFCRVGVSSDLIPGGEITVLPLNVFVGPSLDICVPDSCNATDVDILINKTLEEALFHFNPLKIVGEKTMCLEELPWETKTIMFIVSVVLTFVSQGFCTFYDIMWIQRPRWKMMKLKAHLKAQRKAMLKSTENQGSDQTNNHLSDNDRATLLQVQRGRARKRGRGGQDDDDNNDIKYEISDDILFHEPELSAMASTLQIFSIYTNGANLISTDISDGNLTCVNGLRFITMSWIVLCHCLVFGMVAVGNNVTFFLRMSQDLYTLIVSNGFVCVNTYFVISGIMVGYSFHKVHSAESKLKWPAFVIQRFARLSPTMITAGFAYISLWPHLGTGPNYPPQAPDEPLCRETWAYTAFYINNFLGSEKMCMLWTWYLACDFQFYLLSPFLMIPLVRGWRKLGVSMAVLLIVGTMVATGIVSYHFNLGETVFQIATEDGGFTSFETYMKEMYFRPYTRLSPYILGLLLGYVLKTTNHTVKMPLPVVLLGWLASAVAFFATIFGVYNSYSFTQLMTQTEAAVYNAFKATSFSLASSWVIFASVTGHGGFLNTVLSWKAFLPLSRMCYCIYLVHVPVIYLFSYSIPHDVWMTPWILVMHWLGVLIISIVIAAVLTLTVEMPGIRLIKKTLRKLEINF